MVKRTKVAVAVLAVVALTLAAAGWVHAERVSRREYMDLADRADRLWEEYKRADRAYFDHGRVGLDRHVERLAEIQGQLAGLHTEWMGVEVNRAAAVMDLKVGLALELQMAAVGAEIVGLLDDDQSYLELSSQLDTTYAEVVDDL